MPVEFDLRKEVICISLFYCLIKYVTGLANWKINNCLNTLFTDVIYYGNDKEADKKLDQEDDQNNADQMKCYGKKKLTPKKKTDKLVKILLHLKA